MSDTTAKDIPVFYGCIVIEKLLRKEKKSREAIMCKKHASFVLRRSG
jgi:hypothetical protein